MNLLLINKNKLIYKEKTFELNDLFTKELYKYSNDNVQKYVSNVCIVNEVYLNRVQPVLALMLFIKENQIELIKIQEIDGLLYPLLVDVARICNIKIVGTSILDKFKKIILGHLNIIASMIYLLWRIILMPHSDRVESKNSKVAIIRTPAARKKMSFLKDVDIKFENLKDEKTVYKCFSRRKRFGWVLKAWLKSYSELNNYKIMIQVNIGVNSAIDAHLYYSKRVVHTLMYSYMLDDYFCANEGSTFYTGNNLDRFAILEEQIAKKYNIKTVCIPHGVEYGFKLPHCFTCDVFYTTSVQAAKHLNALYNEVKFTYNEKIASQMFVVPYKRNNQMKRRSIVFFTEPREVYVNIKIIDELLPRLQNEKMQLSIKLHPKDLKSDYEKYKGRVIFIENFNDAVSKNICFARKSTTLIEAVYNESVAGAILINQKDTAVFKTLPSLQDEKIKEFYSTLDLFEWIKKEFNNESKYTNKVAIQK